MDYLDPDMRNELIADIHTFVHDYIREQLDDQASQVLTKEDYYNQLTSTLNYLRDNLIVEFKD